MYGHPAKEFAYNTAYSEILTVCSLLDRLKAFSLIITFAGIVNDVIDVSKIAYSFIVNFLAL